MSNRSILLILVILAVSLLGATPRTLNGGCSVVFPAGDLSKTNLKLCQMPDLATLLEISISADAGTPSVTMGRYRPNGATTVNLTSSALTTGASGALACSRASASTSINGTTSCSATLQNTSLSKGDWIQLTSGSASTATDIQVSVIWTW